MFGLEQPSVFVNEPREPIDNYMRWMRLIHYGALKQSNISTYGHLMNRDMLFGTSWQTMGVSRPHLIPEPRIVKVTFYWPFCLKIRLIQQTHIHISGY